MNQVAEKAAPDLGVGFVSPTEALDLTTPTGRAMAGLLAVFAELLIAAQRRLSFHSAT